MELNNFYVTIIFSFFKKIKNDCKLLCYLVFSYDSMIKDKSYDSNIKTGTKNKKLKLLIWLIENF